MLHFGNFPLVAGIGFRSPPPPPPPALSLPGGSFIVYSEISSGVSNVLLTGFAVAFFTTVYSNGEKMSTVIPMCTARAMACAGPNALSLVQMSLTLTGRLVTFSGGSFGGEIKSRMFCQRVEELDCQSTVIREETALGIGLNHSRRLPAIPVPKPSGVNTAP